MLGRRIEGPQRRSIASVEGLHEAADAIFAAANADDDLSPDGGRGHRLAISGLRVGDRLAPDEPARFRVERDELGVQCADIDLVIVDRDAAIFGAAAIGRDWTHPVLVFPELFARLGVQRVHVIERRGDIHDAGDDDWRRLPSIPGYQSGRPRRHEACRHCLY